MASDSEVNKETLRRYFSLLEDTLIVTKIPAFTATSKKRRAQQRERFVFFDLGVRNAILGINKNRFTPSEYGLLFEQWLILQLLYYIEATNKDWRLSSFRTDQGDEVDIVIETADSITAIEIKFGETLTPKMCKSLQLFRELVPGKHIKSYLVYRGQEKQLFDCGTVGINFGEFLQDIDKLVTN